MASMVVIQELRPIPHVVFSLRRTQEWRTEVKEVSNIKLLLLRFKKLSQTSDSN